MIRVLPFFLALSGCYRGQSPADAGQSPLCSPVRVSAFSPFPMPLLDGVASPPVSGKIYLLGGSPPRPPKPDAGEWNWGFYPNVWSYDIARDTFQELGAALPYALGAVRRNGIAVGKTGKIYIPPAQGPRFDEGYGIHRCMIELDPVSGISTERACFPSVRWGLRLVADRDGIIWVFAGWDGSAVDEIWSYDPAADVLTKIAATCGGTDQGMAGDVIQDSILGPDGVIYHFNHKDVAAFDPATKRFTILGPHGLTGVEKLWVGKDGLVHGFTSAFLSRFTMHLASGRVTATEIPQVTKKEDAAISVDAAAGHLYLFAGKVNSVERFDCLP